MSNRNTNDAEVERVVRWIKYSSQEVTLIEMTKTWSDADLLYAFDRIEIDLPKENRDQVRELYRTRRTERLAIDARLAFEEANSKRHDELARRIEELKKPHWSIVPNFWMTAAILILTAIGVIAALLALRH